MKKIYSLCLMAMMAIAAMAQYPTRIYLCGPAGPGWATETWPMYTYVEEDGVTPTGVYEWVGDLAEGQIKFLYGSSWEPAFVAVEDGEALSEGDHAMSTRLSGEDPDNKWVAVEGRYKLVIDLTGEAGVLRVADGTGLDDKNGEDQHFEAPVPEQVYPVGDGTEYGWTPGLSEPIAKAEGADVFDGVVFLHNGEFKLLHQPDWGAQYGPTENGEIISGAGVYSLCKPEGDNKWKIDGIEELTAYHMIADVEAGTLVLRDTTVEIPALAQLYALGDAVGGWSFDDNAVVLLPKEGVDSVYYAVGVELVMGELKFFEKTDYSAAAWGATVENDPVMDYGEFDLVKLTDDVKFLVMGAMTVDIMVDIKNGKMVLTEATGIENTMVSEQASKVIINGQLYIKKGEHVYNVLGAK